MTLKMRRKRIYLKMMTMTTVPITEKEACLTQNGQRRRKSSVFGFRECFGVTVTPSPNKVVTGIF